MSGPDLDNLAAAIRARRMAMGAPRQADLATKAGVSDTTWNLAETGKVVGVRSLAKIAVALDWAPDVPQRLLDGAMRPEEVLGAQAPIRLSAHGVDLDELHERDPEAYEAIIRQAQIALNRARERQPG